MILVRVYENGDELITERKFIDLPAACAWIGTMGITGVSYEVKLA